jgi:hypothetical protein
MWRRGKSEEKKKAHHGASLEKELFDDPLTASA